MIRRYLMAVTDEDAAHLERWLGAPLVLGPAGDIHAGIVPAALVEVEGRRLRQAQTDLDLLLAHERGEHESQRVPMCGRC